MPLDLIGVTAFALAAAGAVAAYAGPERRPWWQSRWLFTLLLSVAYFAFQRDAIRANFQLWNPDESQMIAGALKLREKPVFWRDVDGSTHGPLDQLPLLLPALVGARLDYTSARMVAALVIILTLCCLTRVLAQRLREGTARLLVLPGWALFIFNQDPETAQYGSELMPALLLAGAVALLSAAMDPKRGPWWRWLAGFACGATPLAKLQAAPLAAWIFLWLLFDLWLLADPSPRWRRLVPLLVGAFTPILYFAGTAAAVGAWADFRIRYLEVNLFGYIGQAPALFNNALPSPGMIFGLSEFLWPVVAAVIAATIASVLWLKKGPNRPYTFALGLVGIAIVAIYAPNKPFAHYFLLLIGPLLLLLGAAAGPVLERLAGHLSAWSRTGVAVTVAALLCGFSVAHHFRHPDYFAYILRSRPALPRELLEALDRRIAPGETLAVWGWQPALYVTTQTIAATPDLLIFWQVVPTRWQQFYRTRYLHSFAASQPVVFVDTMGSSDFFFFHNSETTRHENFPELHALIARDYLLAETTADCRIYVRRDRLAEAAP